MNANTRINRRDFLKVLTYGAATAVAGCTSMNHDYRKSGLVKPLNDIIDEVPAHGGELYYVGKIKKGKRIESVEWGEVTDTTMTHTVIGDDLFITPTYKEGAKKGAQEVKFAVHYTDGVSYDIKKSINFTPETKGEREARIFNEDNEALTNLRRGAYLVASGENEGKRFMPKETNRAYIEGHDYVDVDTSQLTKKGLAADANQDFQRALDDFGKALTGKATYCYRNKAGELYASRLKGLPQSLDYLAQTILDTLSNTTEVGLQAVALDDRGAQNIAGAYDCLDGVLQVVKDSTLIGGGQARSWTGGFDALGKKKLANLKDGQSLRVVLGDDYYASVRKSGLRTTIDVLTTLGHNALLTIAIVKNNSNGGKSGGGIIVEVEPPAPEFPWPPGGPPGTGN